MYKVVTVVGARPQFIKAAALSRALAKEANIAEVIVHSGQHYDHNLSESFFQELNIPCPKYNLGIGSASHNIQMAKFIMAFDEILMVENPHLVVVYGDTNTTAAAAIAASKRNISLAHVEAGLREWNKAIPEEVNKLLTDAVTDLYFCPTQTGVENLVKSGITKNVHLTGDISLDLLFGEDTQYLDKQVLINRFGLQEKYVFMTCHRDRNTDNKENLKAILNAIGSLSYQVVLPLHPRTKKAIQKHDIEDLISENVLLLEPLSFWTTQSLLKHAHLAITDSGGIIKEAYFHEVPTIIIDQQTEWLEAVEEGWAIVAGPDQVAITNAVLSISMPSYNSQALGDGMSGQRIVKTIVKYLNEQRH